MHKGASQIKKTKIFILVYAYEIFKMNEGETIPEMHDCFIKITNDLKCLGKIYPNKEQDMKVLRSLPRS